MNVLVTGGLGYIGSHTCVLLAEAGHRLVVLDNLSNAKPVVLERLRELTRRDVEFHKADLRERRSLDAAFARPVDAVIHFAGLKAVGESVEKPQLYHDNNVGGSVNLLEAMKAHGVRRVVFSSSATVYGDPQKLPLTEDHRLQATNPYGENKIEIEQLLKKSEVEYAALRYFNPIGAHPSGRIGEDPRGIPNNLMPYIAQVAVGKLPSLRVWGRDYKTPDGTGVRDYIHVMDLARGHLSALDFLNNKNRSITVNLGTGRGYSVLEAVKAFEKASGRKIPLEFHPRRAGDVAASYADASLAARELGWKAALDIDDMCRDAWNWQSRNPDGY